MQCVLRIRVVLLTLCVVLMRLTPGIGPMPISVLLFYLISLNISKQREGVDGCPDPRTPKWILFKIWVILTKNDQSGFSNK